VNQKESKKREAYYADETALPPECDCMCPFRPCFSKYENKGSFSPGRGYTSYSETFRPACGTRLSRGCPAWRGKPDDRVDIRRALETAAEQLEAEKRRPRTAREKKLHRRALDIVKAAARLAGMRKQHAELTRMWHRTSELLPRQTPGAKAFVLMWSAGWAAHVYGMFTNRDDGIFEWASYDPVEDRFHDWPEVPEWWCEVERPEAPA